MSPWTVGCRMRKHMKGELEETGDECTEVPQRGNASRQKQFLDSSYLPNTLIHLPSAE